MRSPRFVSVVGLLVIALGLAAANLWYAAARSTIPLALDDVVEERRLVAEKHPGVDDVYLVTLTQAGTMQVDQAVYDAIHKGDRVNKRAWSRQLICNERTIELAWSEDFVGLAIVMPLALLITAAKLATIVCMPQAIWKNLPWDA